MKLAFPWNDTVIERPKRFIKCNSLFFLNLQENQEKNVYENFIFNLNLFFMVWKYFSLNWLLSLIASEMLQSIKKICILNWISYFCRIYKHFVYICHDLIINCVQFIYLYICNELLYLHCILSTIKINRY